MDVGGGEIGRPVQRAQVMAIEIGEDVQGLTPLQTAEDVAEQQRQDDRIDRIEEGSHLRVGGDWMP